MHFDRNADLAKSVSDFVLEGAIPEGVMFGEKIAREFTPNLIQGLNEFGISVSKLTEDPLQKTAIIENDFQKIISRFHLHQNCRNAGKVYDIVRRFNPEAPNISEFVKAMGQIHATIDGDGFDTLGSVLRQAISDIGQRDLVIVSLCNDEFVRAKIHGKQFFQGTPEYWRPALEKLVKVFRDAVNFHINDFYAKQDIRREELLSIIGSIELPKFSSRAFFSKADVGQIYDYVGKVRNALPQLPRSRSHFYQWVIQGGAVRLARNPLLATKPRSAHARSMGSTLAPLFHRHLNTESLLASLNDQICSDAFYSEIPEPPKIYIYDPEKPYSAHCTSRMEDKAIQIPVYSLEQFKGLEVDGVVLLCDQSDREVEQAMYVGASRAKFYLSIVASPKFRLRQPKLTDLWD